MPNEGDRPEPPPPSSSPPSQLPPPLPQFFQIPVQLLEQWMAIPAAERLQTDLTRQDLDNLIFGLLKSADAQLKLEQTVVEWSNGRLDPANAALGEFRRFNVESQNYLRQFFTALMVAAIRGRSNG